MSEFQTAVVFGKFWPLHVGHLRLIREALSRADRVIVAVNDGNEDVPAEVRMAWVAEECPSAAVVSAPDLCGHDTDQCTPMCSERYATWLTANHDSVEAVFSGEPYGPLLASFLGATSVRLDRGDREWAGREIRPDIPGHWRLLSAAARAWYCRRVVIVGAESTGTTTLAADLAERLGTIWVPEYGRQFTAAHGIEHHWVSADFESIARQQAADEDRAARICGPVLVADTDVLATAVWHERYLGRRSDVVEEMAAARRPHFYVLTGDDIPFVQDGLRDGEAIRGWMTQRFREVLGAAGVPWFEVRGSRQERTERVVSALTREFGMSWITAQDTQFSSESAPSKIRTCAPGSGGQCSIP
jgi:HTH-type transcriptional regulator, transcriptional repressor of NAD biosynthesis genes